MIAVSSDLKLTNSLSHKVLAIHASINGFILVALFFKFHLASTVSLLTAVKSWFYLRAHHLLSQLPCRRIMVIFNSGVIPISQHPEHRNHPHRVELIMMFLNELVFSFREVGG